MADTKEKEKKTTKSTKSNSKNKKKNKNNFDPKWKTKKANATSKVDSSKTTTKKKDTSKKEVKKVVKEEVKKEEVKVEKKLKILDEIELIDDEIIGEEVEVSSETKKAIVEQVIAAIEKYNLENKNTKTLDEKNKEDKSKDKVKVKPKKEKVEVKVEEPKTEKKEEVKVETKVEEKTETKVEESKAEEPKVEVKAETKKETKKNDNVFDLPSKEDLDEVFRDIKIETLPSKEEIEVSKKRHYNYIARVCTLVFMILLFLVLCITFAFKAFDYELGGATTYSEYTINNYTVCPSNMNGEACLEKDMDYISNMVGNIHSSFMYEAVYSKKVVVNDSYKVIGTVNIFDKTDKSKLRYTKEDVLIDKTNLDINAEVVSFSTDLDINFVDYRNMVLDYNNKTGVESAGELEIALLLNEGNVERKVSYITIPLTEETFMIDSVTLDNQNQLVLFNKNSKNIDPLFVFMAVICLLMDILLVTYLTNFIHIVKHLDNKYVAKLKGILKEYDDIIVNAANGYKIPEGMQLIKVSSFSELLDARNTLVKPIVYEKINSVKSKFYVEDEKTVYVYTMKDDGK